jgi:hypothetical protein
VSTGRYVFTVETDGLDTTMKLDLMMTTLLVLPAAFAIVQPHGTTRSASLDPQEPHGACSEGPAGL